MGGQFFQPQIIVMVQPWLVIVDEHRSGDVHGVHQAIATMVHGLLSMASWKPPDPPTIRPWASESAWGFLLKNQKNCLKNQATPWEQSKIEFSILTLPHYPAFLP
jgi:hypothetical protein